MVCDFIVQYINKNRQDQIVCKSRTFAKVKRPSRPFEAGRDARSTLNVRQFLNNSALNIHKLGVCGARKLSGADLRGCVADFAEVRFAQLPHSACSELRA